MPKLIFNDDTQKMMDGFLASTLGMTERGLRSLKQNNPDRYERELVGALVLANEPYSSNLLSHFNRNTQLGVFDNTMKKKVRAIEVLMGKDDSFDIQHSRFITNFLDSLFRGYYGENGESLSFSFHNWIGDNSSDATRFQELLPVLTVKLVDSTCGDFDSVKEEDFYVSNLDTGEMFTLKKIQDDILAHPTFKDVKKRPQKTYKNTYDLKFRMENAGNSLASVNVQYSVGDWHFYEGDSNLVPSLFTGSLMNDFENASLVTCKGITHSFDFNDDKKAFESILALCELSGCHETDEAKILIEKIRKELALEEASDATTSYILALESVLLDSIQKGLATAHREIGDFHYGGVFTPNTDEAIQPTVEGKGKERGLYMTIKQNMKTLGHESLTGCNAMRVKTEEE